MTSAKMLPGPLPEPIAETSMPNQSTDGELDAEPVPSGNVGERAEDLGRICLALMSRLEASLAGSRRALLALDLGGIERGTREQIGWVREFETLLERYRLAPLSREALAGEEFRRSGERIVAVLRLQAALLARGRSKLRVLANMLAGPSADYGVLLRKNRMLCRDFGSRRSGDV
jgi:hypothetical protein